MPLATRISPFQAPNYDIFSPARRHDDRGIVVGAPLDGGQNYTPWIGLSTIRELALKHSAATGLVTREELRHVAERADAAEYKLARAQKHIAELEARQDRIAGFASDGFRVVKAAGRPKKEPVA